LAAGKETVDLSYLSPEQVEELKTNLSTLGQELGSAHVSALNDAIKNYDIAEYYVRLEE
jgi:hypothetical protein